MEHQQPQGHLYISNIAAPEVADAVGLQAAAFICEAFAGSPSDMPVSRADCFVLCSKATSTCIGLFCLSFSLQTSLG